MVDWKIFDTYFINITGSAGGDQYLGRIIAGLNPLSSDFGTLPPHFTCDGTHVDAKEAMLLTFGALLEQHTDLEQLSGMLMLCLASLVYHSAWLTEQANTDPAHPFNNTTLLNNSALLAKLKPLVVLEATDNMPKATGVPPHVDNAIKMDALIVEVKEVLVEVKKIPTACKEYITEAFEEHEHANQTPSMAVINRALDERLKPLATQIQSIVDRIPGSTHRSAETPDAPAPAAVVSPLGMHHWGGRFWDVPQDFVFSTPSRWTGWVLWLLGLPDKGIRPFREMRAAALPKTTSGFKAIVQNDAHFRAYSGEYIMDGEHNGKHVFKCKSGAIIYFDATWKWNKTDDKTHWQYSSIDIADNELAEPPLKSTSWQPNSAERALAVPTAQNLSFKKLKTLYVVFKQEWAPIFRLMELGLDGGIPSGEITAEFIKSSYAEASSYIKDERASYIYEATRKGVPNPETWTLSTWSQKTKRSSIMKSGNAHDIGHLPAATFRNQKRPRVTMSESE